MEITSDIFDTAVREQHPPHFTGIRIVLVFRALKISDADRIPFLQENIPDFQEQPITFHPIFSPL